MALLHLRTRGCLFAETRYTRRRFRFARLKAVDGDVCEPSERFRASASSFFNEHSAAALCFINFNCGVKSVRVRSHRLIAKKRECFNL